MLRLCPSLPRQSNPSILTAAGLDPNFIILTPPAPPPPPPPPPPAGLRAGDGAREKGVTFSFPNWASWITGFEALLGGDPQKYGGDEATWWPDLSDPCNEKKNRSENRDIVVEQNPQKRSGTEQYLGENDVKKLRPILGIIMTGVRQTRKTKIN